MSVTDTLMTAVEKRAGSPSGEPAPGLADPAPVRWTVDDLSRMDEAGLLIGRRVMLLDGELIDMGFQGPSHAMVVALVQAALTAAFGPGWTVRCQMPLLLGRGTDPEPDLAVVAGGPRDWRGHPTTAALVVEVADSSLRIDRGRKAALYAAAGIAEYWIVDVAGGRLEVHRRPVAAAGTTDTHACAYGEVISLAPGETVTPLAGGSAVAVSDLLP